MYAIFQSGGKQHRVKEGQIVRLEKLDKTPSESIIFTKVLMVVNTEKIKIGNPFVDESIITAEIVAHGRTNKVKVVKFRCRKHYRKQKNHRQFFTDVKITTISA